MKKFCRIIGLVLILVSIFGLTCIASAETTDSVSDSSTVTFEHNDQESVNEIVFSMVPEENKAYVTYCKEVFKRICKEINEGCFITTEEYDFLENSGYNVLDSGRTVHKYDEKYGGLARYEFPVIYQSDYGIELWYINSYGELAIQAIDGKLECGRTWENRGFVHYSKNNENQEVLTSCAYYSILYDSTTGCISVWELGVNVRKHYVPENSIYAGFSGNEGFIFRDGSNVYAVRDYGCGADNYEVILIARDVEFIIATDYEADGTEGLSQPLFLMKDGTIRFYCTWYSEEGIPVDDDSNLIDVRFERGFNL